MKFGLTAVFLAGLGATSAFGATLPDSCATTQSVTFAFSITQSAIECGDKIFSNFTGTASGLVTISQNTATGYEVFLKAPTGGISTAFTYGFTVTVDTSVCATCKITQIQQNMQTTQAGNTGMQIPNASTGTNSINNGGSFVPAITNALAVGNQNALASGLSNTSYTLGFSYDPIGTPGQTPGIFLNLDDVITQAATVVPEPMTLSLMGLGLLGLGAFRRKRA